MHTNISDCSSVEEYSSSIYSVKVQGHVLHRDEETTHQDKQGQFSQRGAVFDPLSGEPMKHCF